MDMMKFKQFLTEANRKEIVARIDDYFLKHKIRRGQLGPVTFNGFKNDCMYFSVDSSQFAKNGITYIIRIKFIEWRKIGMRSDLNWIQKARLLLQQGNIKIDCTDPSFLYWGFQYMLTQINASIRRESRPPNIRNPRRRGIVSKHPSKVLQVLPFYSGDIAQELKRQFNGKVTILSKRTKRRNSNKLST